MYVTGSTQKFVTDFHKRKSVVSDRLFPHIIICTLKLSVKT